MGVLDIEQAAPGKQSPANDVAKALDVQPLVGMRHQRLVDKLETCHNLLAKGGHSIKIRYATTVWLSTISRCCTPLVCVCVETLKREVSPLVTEKKKKQKEKDPPKKDTTNV